MTGLEWSWFSKEVESRSGLRRRFSDEEGFQMKKILRITITADWDKAGFQMKKISRWRWLIFCRWRRFVDGVYWYEGSYIRRLKRLCVRRYVLGSFLAFFFIFDHYFCISGGLLRNPDFGRIFTYIRISFIYIDVGLCEVNILFWYRILLKEFNM